MIYNPPAPVVILSFSDLDSWEPPYVFESTVVLFDFRLLRLIIFRLFSPFIFPFFPPLTRGFDAGCFSLQPSCRAHRQHYPPSRAFRHCVRFQFSSVRFFVPRAVHIFVYPPYPSCVFSLCFSSLPTTDPLVHSHPSGNTASSAVMTMSPSSFSKMSPAT